MSVRRPDARAMTDEQDKARVERLFLFAFVPAIIFMLVSFYVRFTRDPDPLWSELAFPLFLVLMGVRSLVLPSPPETRKLMRGVGILLIILSVAVAILAIRDSQGA